MIEIANAVGLGNLDVELDVAEVAADPSAQYTEYNLDNCHAFYVRVTERSHLSTFTGEESTTRLEIAILFLRVFFLEQVG